MNPSIPDAISLISIYPWSELAIPCDCHPAIIQWAILNGDYSRVVAVSKGWEIASRNVFFTLIPHFRTRLFKPVRVKSKRTPWNVHTLFDIPKIPRKPIMEGEIIFGRVMRESIIVGCTTMQVKTAEYACERNGHVWVLRAPFGLIEILFNNQNCFSSMCHQEKTITMTRSCGDEAAMQRYLLVLIPSLQGRNLHSSWHCVICGWRNRILGCSLYNDRVAGRDDAILGLAPDMILNPDYMEAYRSIREWKGDLDVDADGIV